MEEATSMIVSPTPDSIPQTVARVTGISYHQSSHKNIIISEIYNDEGMHNTTTFNEVQLRYLEHLNNQLRYHEDQIDAVVNTLNVQKNYIQCHIELVKEVIKNKTFFDQLPLKSQEKTTEFNTMIEQRPDLFNLLVKLLSSAGGDTNKKIIYNVMSKLMSNEAATSYSVGGKKKGKECFNDLRLYAAVIEAAKAKQIPNDGIVRKLVTDFFAKAS